MCQMLMVPTPTMLVPLLRPHPSLISWGVPFNHLMRKKDAGPGLYMILHGMQAQPESGQLQHYTPFLEHP